MPFPKRGLSLTEQLLAARGAPRAKIREQLRDAQRGWNAERFRRTVASRLPFAERMLLFWRNHFTVSASLPPVVGLAHAFEAQAIAPHCFGRFSDLLLATTRHPAMLEYLDARSSFGPNSFEGRWKGRGLNENLAREILELHTLGVDGGYRQGDVEALAKILTGWSLRLDPYSRALIPKFGFQPAVHEPGPKSLLGRSFPETGESEGIEALEMLAQHPSTATHLARKLAVHFISDRPPESAVRRLAGVFRDTQGDLGAVSRALVDMDAVWATPLAKLKTPYELVLSACRMLDATPNPKQLGRWLNSMGYRMYAPDSPAGYPDTAADWSGPGPMGARIRWALRAADLLGADQDPEQLASRSIAPVMSEGSRFAIANAPTKEEGLALLLSSPEFQRR
jgi:uncharacterized protein (DUF1800 family)